MALIQPPQCAAPPSPPPRAHVLVAMAPARRGGWEGTGVVGSRARVRAWCGTSRDLPAAVLGASLVIALPGPCGARAPPPPPLGPCREDRGARARERAAFFPTSPHKRRALQDAGRAGRGAQIKGDGANNQHHRKSGQSTSINPGTHRLPRSTRRTTRPPGSSPSIGGPRQACAVVCQPTNRDRSIDGDG